MQIQIQGEGDKIVKVYGIQYRGMPFPDRTNFEATKDHPAGVEFQGEFQGDYRGTVVLYMGRGCLWIHCYYNHIWWFAPSRRFLSDTGPHTFPNWPIRIAPGTDSSTPLVTIEAPDGVDVGFITHPFG